MDKIYNINIMKSIIMLNKIITVIILLSLQL